MSITEPKHPDFVNILQNFIRQYGKEKGTQNYYAWLNKLHLDDTKPYKNKDQLTECQGPLCESFSWLDEPLIQFYKEDKEAKYYKCLALTANISMNRNDYTDLDDHTAGSIRWRPLNLNHRPETQLAFPDNRVDYAQKEDRGLETVIRIHNSRKDIQRKIENGEIVHPSIEGEPRGMRVTDTGRSPLKWNFTALALLEKDVTLPGDPLTYLVPIAVNESMGSNLLETLSMEGDENMDETKTSEQVAENILKEALYGVPESCGQCQFFEDMTNTTKDIPHVTGGDSVQITRTEGSFGPGVGKCKVAESAGTVSPFVKKNDPACTDGRLRMLPTGPERTIENIDGVKEIEEIKLEAIKAEYETRLSEKEQQLLAEQNRTSEEVENRLIKERELSEIAVKLSTKTREHKDSETRLTLRTEERDELRNTVNDLKETITEMKIAIDITDKDIKHYNDENNAYKRTVQKLKDSSVTRERLLVEQIRRSNEEAEKRSLAVEQAKNAVSDKIRIQEEASRLQELLTQKQQEITDGSQLRYDGSKRELKLQAEVSKLKEEIQGYIDSIRELKQDIAKQKQRPNKITLKVK